MSLKIEEMCSNFSSWYQSHNLTLKLPNFHHLRCHVATNSINLCPPYATTTQVDERFHQIPKNIIQNSINGHSFSIDVLQKVSSLFLCVYFIHISHFQYDDYTKQDEIEYLSPTIKLNYSKLVYKKQSESFADGTLVGLSKDSRALPDHEWIPDGDVNSFYYATGTYLFIYYYAHLVANWKQDFIRMEKL